MKIRDAFSNLSRKAAEISGTWQASILSILVVLIWAATGPIFGFSDTWQLICNTGTTIITFIMVFLIQGASNRDQKSLQIKLNEIIHVLEKADDKLINIEHATDDEICDAEKNVSSHKEKD
jgi:low affinity Fe/Cu permease